MNTTTKQFLTSLLVETAMTASLCAAASTVTGQPDTDESNTYALDRIKDVWEDTKDAPRPSRDRRVTIAELAAMPVEDLSNLGFLPWDDKLSLIPLWAINYIADGESLTDINGGTTVKGEAPLNLSSRMGCTAYGFARAAAEAAEAEAGTQSDDTVLTDPLDMLGQDMPAVLQGVGEVLRDKILPEVRDAGQTLENNVLRLSAVMRPKPGSPGIPVMVEISVRHASLADLADIAEAAGVVGVANAVAEALKGPSLH